MIEVTEVKICPDKSKIAFVRINYYGLNILCELCVFKEEKLWLRMPEIWLTATNKKRFVWWETPEESNDFQEKILKKVFDKVGLTLQDAIKIRQDVMSAQRKIRKSGKV